MRRSLVGFVLGLTLAVGCSRPTPETGAGPRSSSLVLTRQEISEAPVNDLYEAVSRLRPTFMRERSTATARNAYPVVYVDGLRKGSLDYLRAIPSREVQEVRYLSAKDATTRYGFNVEAGVIDVKLIGR